MTNDIRHRRGLSLLEVILAIAILGGALATIGELIRIGARNAAMARDLTTAQIYCESKMNEVAAGAVDLSMVGTEPLDEAGEWMCAVETAELDQQELIAVNVTVGQNPELFARPVSFSMTRWIIDPEYAAECAALDAQLKAQARQAAANAKQTAGGGGGGTPVDDGTGGGGGTGGQGGGGTGGGGTGAGGVGGGLPGGPGGPGGEDGGGRGGRGGRGEGGRGEGGRGEGGRGEGGRGGESGGRPGGNDGGSPRGPGGGGSPRGAAGGNPGRGGGRGR